MAKIATTIEQAFDLFNLPENETWKPVVGYEGYYEISSIGRCKRLEMRILKLNHGVLVTQLYKEGLLKPYITKRGYVKYHLNKGIPNGKLIFAHRMVALPFIPNPDNKPHINHKNGIKTDNRLENLEWCTQKENVQHAVDTGLTVAPKGEKQGQSKLKDVDILDIRRKYIPWKYSLKMLAIEYDVDLTTIHAIIKRKKWRHI